MKRISDSKSNSRKGRVRRENKYKGNGKQNYERRRKDRKIAVKEEQSYKSKLEIHKDKT